MTAKDYVDDYLDGSFDDSENFEPFHGKRSSRSNNRHAEDSGDRKITRKPKTETPKRPKKKETE